LTFVQWRCQRKLKRNGRRPKILFNRLRFVA
jgi:hypothetical protein